MSELKEERHDRGGQGGGWTKKNGPWANAWAATGQVDEAGRAPDVADGERVRPTQTDDPQAG